MQKEINKTNPDAKIAITKNSVSAFQGPLPHPDHFEKYNNILPGSAERILKMAENQQKHIFRMEILGIIIAFLVIILCLISCIYLAFLGAYAVSGVIGGSTLLGLITVILTNQKANNDKK